MRILGSTVPERLSRMELFLLGALTSIALLVAVRSIENAVPGKTMWPILFLEQARPFISIRTLIIVAIVIGVYMIMHKRGLSPRAFWLVAFAIIAIHTTAIWAHNQLDWHQLFGRVAVFAEGEPLLLTASLFLVSLAGLTLLHRIMQLRDLAAALSARGIGDTERDRILINELVSISIIIVIALVASTFTVLIGSVVANIDSLAQRVPWSVSVVGMGAVLLFAGFLVLLYRTLSGSETVSQGRVDTDLPTASQPDSQ